MKKKKSLCYPTCTPPVFCSLPFSCVPCQPVYFLSKDLQSHPNVPFFSSHHFSRSVFTSWALKGLHGVKGASYNKNTCTAQLGNNCTFKVCFSVKFLSLAWLFTICIFKSSYDCTLERRASENGWPNKFY